MFFIFFLNSNVNIFFKIIIALEVNFASENSFLF